MYHNYIIFAIDDRPDQRNINRYVVPHYATKWRDLGEALQICSSRLNIIATDNPNSCEERCKAMLRKWLELNPSATWDKLTNAVDRILSNTGTINVLNMHMCIK